eukprot:884410-Heterocapsa_arctica.AAC.1
MARLPPRSLVPVIAPLLPTASRSIVGAPSMPRLRRRAGVTQLGSDRARGRVDICQRGLRPS